MDSFVEQKTIEEAMIETCEAIKINQQSISNLLKIQMSKLEFLEYLVREEDLIVESSILAKDINNIIKMLLAYDCIIENKIESVSRIYNELIKDV